MLSGDEETFGTELKNSRSIDDWVHWLAPDLAGGTPEDPVESCNAGGTPAEPGKKVESDVAGGTPAHRSVWLLSVARMAMACEFEVLLNQHQYPQGTDAAMSALTMIEELELLFSVYKPRSDLSTVNRYGAERPIPVSHDTLQLLLLAQDVHCWTRGAFDITAGSLSEAWGFARRQGRKPDTQEIAEALKLVGSQFVEIDPQHSSVFLRQQGVKINPGGIGKGYALDRAAQRLVQTGVEDFMLHGGLSSIVARGNRQQQDDGGWRVSLKHPWRWEQHLGTLRLLNRALGTSGSGKQFFHFKGKRYSHIIDPRSGWPAQGMMSATVLCPSAGEADALATAFFVMGPIAAREFCEKHPQISAVLIYQQERTGKQQLEAIHLNDDEWIPT